MSTSETSQKVRTFDEMVGMLKQKLKFADWPQPTGMVPGFNPQDQASGLLANYRLERRTLLPLNNSRVTRRYFYRRFDSRLALDLTVIVSQTGPRDAAEGLVLLVAASQKRTEPRVDFQAVGDVTVYRQPDTDQSIAFLRNNVGINIESYGGVDGQFPIRELAQQIDSYLKERQVTDTLAGHERLPRILRFESKASTLKPGERSDLAIEVQDNYPPQDWLFHAINGSYNHDPDANLWYFRAGRQKGSAEVALTVVNNVNLMATARISISID